MLIDKQISMKSLYSKKYSRNKLFSTVFIQFEFRYKKKKKQNCEFFVKIELCLIFNFFEVFLIIGIN